LEQELLKPVRKIKNGKEEGVSKWGGNIRANDKNVLRKMLIFVEVFLFLKQRLTCDLVIIEFVMLLWEWKLLKLIRRLYKKREEDISRMVL
jgi:hypothetical protein